jgi:putative membrane protein
MITAVRIALNEMGRMLSSRLSAAAVIALAMVPLLYSALYLYANSDPYGNFRNVPVALVNNDEGEDNIGGQFIDQVTATDSFEWRVTDEDEARRGVYSGEYTFAVIIDKNFTDDINSLSLMKPAQGSMELVMNDVNSYIMHTVAQQAAAKMQEQISATVGAQVIEKMMEAFSEIYGSLGQAVDGASQLADGASQALVGANQLVDGVAEFGDGLNKLADGLADLNGQTASMPASTQQLADGASQVAAGVAELDGIADRLGDAENKIYGFITDNRIAGIGGIDIVADLRDSSDKLHSDVQGAVAQVDELSAGAQQLSDGMAQLNAASPKLASGVSQLNSGAKQLKSSFPQIQDGVTQLRDALSQISAGAAQLRDALSGGAGQIPNLSEDSRAAFAQGVMNPVSIVESTQAVASGYAAGLAPFFMALAAWVGVYVLFILFKPISTRALAANVTAWKVVVGGLLTPAMIGVAQMTLMYGAVGLVIGLKPAHALLTWLFLIFISMTYLTIVHSLVTAFGEVGLFVGLVLMIVQLTSSGGTFPWQTLPAIDQIFYHILPMSHATDALRCLIYGGSMAVAGQKVLVLLLYMAVFVFIDMLIVLRRRRWSIEQIMPVI